MESEVIVYLIFMVMEIDYYNVTELTLNEKSQVNGGMFWIPLALLACKAIIDDWDNFKAGLAGRPEVPK